MIEIKQIDRDSILYLVRELEEFEKSKAIKKGLQAGGNVIKVEGRRRLKERLKSTGTGKLLNSFQVRVKRNKAGVLTGFNGGGRHSHLVDRGTKKRLTKSGANRGIMPANSFWSDTESVDYPKAVDKIFAGVEKAVQRINDRKA